MIARLKSTHALAGLALVLATALAAAAAQEPTGAVQGLSMNRDQPVKIESSTLEVRDKQREATFSGGVTLTQGETVLKCKTLVVFYEDTAMAPAKKGAPAQGAPQSAPQGAPQAQKSGQQIKRAEAKGDVFVTQKDQTASGDNAVYDLKSNTIVMTGNVVLTQGPQILRGAKMVVQLATGLYSFVGGVEMVANPGAAKDPTPPTKDAKSAPVAAQPAKSAPRGPIKIN